MRKLPLFLILIFVLGFIFYSSIAIGQPAENSNIIVYYFHGDFRCPTCYRLEQYSKEAAETNFREQLTSGKLVFKVINVDKPSNRHFIDDYQLYTKSLVISLLKNGKEIKFKNLTKIWEYVGNKQKFFAYVKDEINNFLSE